MYELIMKVFVKIGEGEDATYGCSERRKALTKEELADPTVLDKLAQDALNSIANDPRTEGKPVVAVSQQEYDEFDETNSMMGKIAAMLGLGKGNRGSGMSLMDLLGGGDGEHEHNCAACDAEDCPIRTAEYDGEDSESDPFADPRIN